MNRLLALLAIILTLSACYKHDSKITAPNWPNKAREGKYCVSDTQIYFQHDLTRGWYDTVISRFTIKVCAPKQDSLIFDTVITWGAIWPEGFRYYDNCSRFAYTSYNYYYQLSGDGQFNGDTLTYGWRILPMPTSGGLVARSGRGVRYEMPL